MREADLERLASTRYDVVVIGGGITGAAVAWDAALRGLRVALVEKGDFAHGTSSATSKLVHGGLRYLRRLEVGLVRESLRERRILEAISPHQVYPLSFLTPAYGWGSDGPVALLVGAALYNLLGYDRHRLSDPDRRLPGARVVSRRALLELEPSLADGRLTGGLHYFDCQLYAPERHTLEFVLSAVDRGATALNYVEATGVCTAQGSVRGVRVRDRLAGDTFVVRGRTVVNAAGPWADGVLGLIQGSPTHHVVRSKGIHIVTRALGPRHAVALPTPSGRHLFILPWRGRSLIGTTDVIYHGSPDRVSVTEQEVRDLVDEVNAVYPAGGLRLEDVQHWYAGLRPIVEEGTTAEDVYRASRRYEIYDHGEEHVAGLFTAIGGKYTTSRHLAERLVDRLLDRLRLPPVRCRTHRTPLLGGGTGRYRDFIEGVGDRYPSLSTATLAHLAHSYGTRVHDMLAEAEDDVALLEPVGARTGDVGAQVRFAVRREMAHTLGDVLFRRTGVGTLGHPGRGALERVAGIMGAELGWTAGEREAQLAAAERAFTLDRGGDEHAAPLCGASRAS